MATFSKKIKIKNSSGETQTALIYSTTNESGIPFLSINVDDINGYACLVDINNTRATSGRVKKSDGTIYAIGENGIPEYGYSYLSTNGSFTVPAGVTKLKVTCVGGGAGGNVSYIESGIRIEDIFVYDGEAGGETNFGNLVLANGGTASINRYTVSCSGFGSDRECTVTNIIQTESYGFNNGGRCITNNPNPGGASVVLTTITGLQVASVGGGGSADPQISVCFPGASGYMTIETINVTPGQILNYYIGSGGRGRRYSNLYPYCTSSAGSGSCPGEKGGILVEWGQGIQ